MGTFVTAFHHVNITVRPSDEEATKHFYGVTMGLTEVPKPESSRGRGGAWYQLGPVQLHVSREEGVDNQFAKRHFCLLVADLKATERHLRNAGVEILPDEQPIPGSPRFYVRDPGGNRIEISGPLPIVD
jgi:catechol 2,3-dioxygenase-like lactoylglutathione lyase family enzyme